MYLCELGGFLQMAHLALDIWFGGDITIFCIGLELGCVHRPASGV